MTSEINKQTFEKSHSVHGHQHITTWAPVGDSKARIVLVHGLAEHAGRYDRTGELLAASGFEVIAPDLFGFGRSGGEKGHLEEWSHYADQIEELIQEARQSGNKVVLMGHSLGGLICAEYGLIDRSQPDLLVLSAPALTGGARWQRVLAPILAKIAPRALVPNALDGEELSRDPDVGTAYFEDPHVLPKSSALFGALAFAAQDFVAANLEKWHLPTLVMHGGADTIVPASGSVRLEDLPGVERRLYPKLRHEILNEPEGPELVQEIADWIHERIG